MTSTSRYILFSIIGLVVLLLALAGYVFLWSNGSTPRSNVATSTPNIASKNTPVTVNETPAQPLSIIQHGTYYDIDMQYPGSTPLTQSVGATENAAAVQRMKTFAENTIQTFEKDGNFANLTPQEAQYQGLNQYNKYSLTNEYKVFYGPYTVTYLFSVVEDTLGAHPNSNYHTFTFDLRTGQSISLSDVFVPDSNYLAELTKVTRAALTTQLGSQADASQMNPGTTAVAINFQNFAIDGSNLVIFFSPYQVASYAQGPQTVKIPLSQLSDILIAHYK
jgi:hypothetical protein